MRRASALDDFRTPAPFQFSNRIRPASETFHALQRYPSLPDAKQTKNAGDQRPRPAFERAARYNGRCRRQKRLTQPSPANAVSIKLDEAGSGTAATSANTAMQPLGHTDPGFASPPPNGT